MQEYPNDKLNNYKFGIIPTKARSNGNRLLSDNTRRRDESKIQQIEQYKMNREMVNLQKNNKITGETLTILEDRGEKNKPMWSFSKYLEKIRK